MTAVTAKRFESLQQCKKLLSECASTHLTPSSQEHHPYEKALLRACEVEKQAALKQGLLHLMKAVELRQTSHGVELMEVPLPRISLPMPDMPLNVKRNLGALMGYVCLLEQHLSRCLDVPLLHVSQFECSTSHVMKPERIFDRRKSPRWTKHRLYLSQEDSSHEANWQELVSGVHLMKRSLMCLAASICNDAPLERVAFSDLLLFLLARVIMELI